MIWNAKAVNRSSKCNPGSQTVWFEKSLHVGQRESIPHTRVLEATQADTWRRLIRSSPRTEVGESRRDFTSAYSDERTTNAPLQIPAASSALSVAPRLSSGIYFALRDIYCDQRITDS
jgi:hypothetical protein